MNSAIFSSHAQVEDLVKNMVFQTTKHYNFLFSNQEVKVVEAMAELPINKATLAKYSQRIKHYLAIQDRVQNEFNAVRKCSARDV